MATPKNPTSIQAQKPGFSFFEKKNAVNTKAAPKPVAIARIAIIGLEESLILGVDDLETYGDKVDSKRMSAYESSPQRQSSFGMFGKKSPPFDRSREPITNRGYGANYIYNRDGSRSYQYNSEDRRRGDSSIDVRRSYHDYSQPTRYGSQFSAAPRRMSQSVDRSSGFRRSGSQGRGYGTTSLVQPSSYAAQQTAYSGNQGKSIPNPNVVLETDPKKLYQNKSGWPTLRSMAEQNRSGRFRDSKRSNMNQQRSGSFPDEARLRTSDYENRYSGRGQSRSRTDLRNDIDLGDQSPGRYSADTIRARRVTDVNAAPRTASLDRKQSIREQIITPKKAPKKKDDLKEILQAVYEMEAQSSAPNETSYGGGNSSYIREKRYNKDSASPAMASYRNGADKFAYESGTSYERYMRDQEASRPPIILNGDITKRFSRAADAALTDTSGQRNIAPSSGYYSRGRSDLTYGNGSQYASGGGTYGQHTGPSGTYYVYSRDGSKTPIKSHSKHVNESSSRVWESSPGRTPTASRGYYSSGTPRILYGAQSSTAVTPGSHYTSGTIYPSGGTQGSFTRTDGEQTTCQSTSRTLESSPSRSTESRYTSGIIYPTASTTSATSGSYYTSGTGTRRRDSTSSVSEDHSHTIEPSPTRTSGSYYSRTTTYGMPSTITSGMDSHYTSGTSYSTAGAQGTTTSPTASYYTSGTIYSSGVAEGKTLDRYRSDQIREAALGGLQTSPTRPPRTGGYYSGSTVITTTASQSGLASTSGSHYTGGAQSGSVTYYTGSRSGYRGVPRSVAQDSSNLIGQDHTTAHTTVLINDKEKMDSTPSGYGTRSTTYERYTSGPSYRKRGSTDYQRVGVKSSITGADHTTAHTTVLPHERGTYSVIGEDNTTAHLTVLPGEHGSHGHRASEYERIGQETGPSAAIDRNADQQYWYSKTGQISPSGRIIDDQTQTPDARIKPKDLSPKRGGVKKMFGKKEDEEFAIPVPETPGHHGGLMDKMKSTGSHHTHHDEHSTHTSLKDKFGHFTERFHSKDKSRSPHSNTMVAKRESPRHDATATAWNKPETSRYQTYSTDPHSTIRNSPSNYAAPTSGMKRSPRTNDFTTETRTLNLESVPAAASAYGRNDERTVYASRTVNLESTPMTASASSRSSNIQTKAGEIVDDVVEGSKRTLTETKETLDSADNTVKEGTTRGLNTVRDKVGTFADDVKSRAASTYNATAEKVGEMAETVKTGTVRTYKDAAEKVGGFADTVKEGTSRSYNQVKEKLDKFDDKVADGTARSYNTVKEKLDRFDDKVAEGAERTRSAIKETFTTDKNETN